MRSPIFFILFWIIVNLVIGSAKRKKTQEKRGYVPKKPSNELNPRTQTSRQLKERRDFRTTTVNRSELKMEDEKETLKQKKDKRIKPQQVYKSAFEESEREKWGDEVFEPSDTEDELKLVILDSAETTSSRSVKMDFHNDIAKGIIFKEILDKPRALRGHK